MTRRQEDFRHHELENARVARRDSSLFARVNGRSLAAALIASVITLVVAIALAWSDATGETDAVCTAAKENRQILRDLVALTEGTDFYEKAKPIVDRRIGCEGAAQ